jgi:hypothetical protein
MLRLKYLLLIVFALLLNGCGQHVVETLNVPQIPDANAPGSGKTIVILPFADYTYSDDLASAYRRNLRVTESLTDNLSGQGFGMPVSEDVFSYLVGQGVVQIADYEDNSNVSLTNELAGDWSTGMKQTIRHYLQQQRTTQKRQVSAAPGTHSLDGPAITKIGRQFQADYVVRGRILEFRTRQEATWEPWKRGLFPVIAGGTAQALYGFAGSDSYDNINQMMTGGMYGLAVGNLSDWPIDGKVISGGISGNEIIWAGIGGLLGDQASKSGRVDQAVVQLRMWVQDASSGQVVWTNRAMVRVSPSSVFADGQYDDLFNTAIEKGVSTLVDNFVASGL